MVCKNSGEEATSGTQLADVPSITFSRLAIRTYGKRLSVGLQMLRTGEICRAAIG